MVKRFFRLMENVLHMVYKHVITEPEGVWVMQNHIHVLLTEALQHSRVWVFMVLHIHQMSRFHIVKGSLTCNNSAFLALNRTSKEPRTVCFEESLWCDYRTTCNTFSINLKNHFTMYACKCEYGSTWNHCRKAFPCHSGTFLVPIREKEVLLKNHIQVNH